MKGASDAATHGATHKPPSTLHRYTVGCLIKLISWTTHKINSDCIGYIYSLTGREYTELMPPRSSPTQGRFAISIERIRMFREQVRCEWCLTKTTKQLASEFNRIRYVRQCASPSNTWFLGNLWSTWPHESVPKCHLDRFSRFAGLTVVTNRQTDRQTDRPTSLLLL